MALIRDNTQRGNLRPNLSANVGLSLGIRRRGDRNVDLDKFTVFATSLKFAVFPHASRRIRQGLLEKGGATSSGPPRGSQVEARQPYSEDQSSLRESLPTCGETQVSVIPYPAEAAEGCGISGVSSTSDIGNLRVLRGERCRRAKFNPFSPRGVAYVWYHVPDRCTSSSVGPSYFPK